MFLPAMVWACSSTFVCPCIVQGFPCDVLRLPELSGSDKIATRSAHDCQTNSRFASLFACLRDFALQRLENETTYLTVLRHGISDALQNISAEDIGVGQPVVRGHAQPAADTSDQCGKRKRSPSPLLWDTITEFDTAPEGDVHNTWLPPHAHAVIPREPLASAVGGCEA